MTAETDSTPAWASVRGCHPNENSGDERQSLPASWIAIVIDGHREVVLGVGYLAVEGDVGHRNIAKLLDRVSDAS